MRPDVDPFLGRVRALLPDTRGHGRSTKFERAEDYTYARKAEDLGPWLDALGVSAAVWGGASMGAALSLWMAVHEPARVRGVISISGPPYAPPPEDKAWWAAHRPLVAAGRFDEYFDANLHLRMGEAALARLKARPARYAELTGVLREHSVASLLALLDVLARRMAGRLRAHPLSRPDHRGRGRPLSYGGDVGAARRHHSRRAPARGGGWTAFPQSHPSCRGAKRDGRVPPLTRRLKRHVPSRRPCDPRTRVLRSPAMWARGDAW